MFVQEVDAFLQNSGLVHLAGVAWQHGPQLLNEDIELVSALLLGLVTGLTVGLGARRFIYLFRIRVNSGYVVVICTIY